MTATLYIPNNCYSNYLEEGFGRRIWKKKVPSKIEEIPEDLFVKIGKKHHLNLADPFLDKTTSRLAILPLFLDKAFIAL